MLLFSLEQGDLFFFGKGAAYICMALAIALSTVVGSSPKPLRIIVHHLWNSILVPYPKFNFIVVSLFVSERTVY